MSIFLKKKKHSRRHGIGNYRLQDARRHCVLNPENERNSRGHHETDSPSPAQHEREQRTEQKTDRRRCRDAPLVCHRRANDRRRRTLPTGALRSYHSTTTTITTTTITAVPQSNRSPRTPLAHAPVETSNQSVGQGFQTCPTEFHN